MLPLPRRHALHPEHDERHERPLQDDPGQSRDDARPDARDGQSAAEPVKGNQNGCRTERTPRSLLPFYPITFFPPCKEGRKNFAKKALSPKPRSAPRGIAQKARQSGLFAFPNSYSLALPLWGDAAQAKK